MRTLGLIIAWWSAIIWGCAQQDNILQFEKRVHDFGQLKEEDRKATYTFKFKNVSDKKVWLTYVKPSCGCTVPEWTKDTLAPGEEGFVKATYNMWGRPGPFTKSITVRYRKEGDTEDRTTTLTIKGVVKPRPKGISDYYPVKYGSLRFNNNHIYFGNITDRDKAKATLKIYNEGNQTITIKSIQLPEAITTEQQLPIRIQPKDSTKITFVLDGAKANDYDYVTYSRVEMLTDDQQQPKKYLYFSVSIMPYFPPLSEKDLAKAPKAKFDKLRHDFGEVKSGELLKTTFKITNEGKQPLRILKTKTSCGCTVSKPAKEVLKPGETTSIEVTFNTQGRSGLQRKTITVITNDPRQPRVLLQISANVVRPSE